MTFMAAAVIGSAVVGGIATTVAGNRAAKSAEKGASRAADATIQNTTLQIDEIKRQFDYQQQILLPQIQTQYNAQAAYSDLLGIGSGAPPPAQAPQQTPEQQATQATQVADLERQIAAAEQATTRGSGGAGSMRRRADSRAQAQYLRQQLADVQGGAGGTPGDALGLPQYPGQGTGVPRVAGPSGEFVDPNLDPTKLADTQTLSQTVQDNLLAGTTAENDPYRNFLSDNPYAADVAGNDAMVQRANDVTLTGARGGVNIADGAAGTGVYGDTFNQSPGYAFQVEEMQRQLERVGSAGGPNIGGRAIIEAQRRAQGLAAGDYYNWASGRERDLGRLGTAEAQDVMRGDQFAGADIARGDTALAGYEDKRLKDIMRNDQGYQNYLQRQAGDASRLDTAATNVDRLQAADLARGDQGYYNYLSNVQRVAGFGGGPAATAINASQNAGSQVANAYGNQGSSLSNIYGDLGTSQANIDFFQGAGVNNAVQGGVQNWITYKAGQPTPDQPPPPGQPAPQPQQYFT